MEHIFFYDTAIGKIAITENDEGITNLYLASQIAVEGRIQAETPLIALAAHQLKEYLLGDRTDFDFPLAPHGTEFQQTVWKALKMIPYGETRTYAQVAQMIGKPRAARAVGMANHNNPILIVIPCHRVIGSNGKLVGYAAGMPLKEQLLHLERHFHQTELAEY